MLPFLLLPWSSIVFSLSIALLYPFLVRHVQENTGARGSLLEPGTL